MTPGSAQLLDAAMHTADGLRDPYRYLDPLVAECESLVTDDGHAYVFGYDLAQTTLRSPDLFKGGEHVSSTSTTFTPEQVETLRRERPNSPGMLSSIDDPDHARLRRLVSVAFTPKAIAPLEELTHDVVDEFLDGLDPAEPIDLLGTLFTTLPSQVVGALIGLPLSDRESFAALAAVSSVGRDPGATYEEQLRAVRARRQMHEYVAGMIDQARRQPADSLVGRLVGLVHEGERISNDELTSLVALMHSAGFGTTKRLMGNGLVALLRHPYQAAALRAAPENARATTDEVLRYDTSVLTVSYFAGDGAAVAGRAIEPGKLVTVVIGAANHDPRVFDEPTEFDVTVPRASAPLSFGYGAHYCLGAALARMETEVVLSELVVRHPEMRLVAEPERVASFRSRSFRDIRVVLGPRAGEAA